MGYYFVEYELYGMQKNIIFNGFFQYQNWANALSSLNDEEYVAFKILSIKSERY